MGVKPKEKAVVDAPGPGQYEIKKESSVAITMGSRREEKK
jgi:hypothetical protein